MSADAYDPITGDPLLHLGPNDDVVYDHERDEWVDAKPAISDRERAELVEHDQHLTDGHWHDNCRWCRRRRVHGGTGTEATDG
jgi:hypothetical protein